MTLLSVTELAAEAAGADADRPGPLVLDARYHLLDDDGYAEFCSGHIPGAVWIDTDHELAGPPGEGGRHPLPDPQVFRRAMRRAGVDDDTAVVVTDGGQLLAAARLWWLLTDAGHASVRVLDGGFAAWRDAGLPIADGPPVSRPTGRFSGRPGRLAVVDAEQVAHQLATGGRSVVDVRTPERFAGESEPIDPVAGHIPGAVNLPAGGVFAADGRLRPAAELGEHFAGTGDDPILYCGSGLTAAQSLLAMRAAGRSDGAIYPGSWSGWITDPQRPVARGR